MWQPKHVGSVCIKRFSGLKDFLHVLLRQIFATGCCISKGVAYKLPIKVKRKHMHAKLSNMLVRGSILMLCKGPRYSGAVATTLGY